MLQRFFIRLILFGLVSMAGSALILSLLFCEIPFFLWGEVSCLLLCIIYSGRWVIYHLGPTFNALLRYGFIALVFGSIPGIIMIIILLSCLIQIMIMVCYIVGTIEILMELVEAIRMDRE